MLEERFEYVRRIADLENRLEIYQDLYRQSKNDARHWKAKYEELQERIERAKRELDYGTRKQA